MALPYLDNSLLIYNYWYCAVLKHFSPPCEFPFDTAFHVDQPHTTIDDMSVNITTDSYKCLAQRQEITNYVEGYMPCMFGDNLSCQRIINCKTKAR